jgi:glyoxylase-like metal-dependent hydrolase (beta-lactamase superfamily II)
MGLLSGIFTSVFDWLSYNFLHYIEFYMSPYKTGRIAENFYVVRSKNANYFVYFDGKNALCFDAGYEEREGKGEFEKLGIDPGRVTHLFLTHSDVDHAGGAALFENAGIYISPGEEGLIEGTTPRAFGGLYGNRPIGRYTRINDGDVIKVGEVKVEAIATPGHTPGSTSYLVDGAILVCGDTLILKDGRVHVLWPVYNMDTGMQKESIKKLAKLKNVKLMVTAHTGGTKDFEYAMEEWSS